MFINTIKKTALISCFFSMIGCSIFSADKELPQGDRIAILTTKEPAMAGTQTWEKIKIEAPAHNTVWSQTGGNAAHLSQNLLASADPVFLWKADFGKGGSKRNFLLSGPVIAQGKVFAQDSEGTVSAFDLLNGKRLWKQKIKPVITNEADNTIKGSGLAVNDKAVFAATGFGAVVALNILTGKQLWRSEISMPVRTAPTLCGDKLIIQSMDNSLFAFNTISGNELWKYNIPVEDTILSGTAASACNLNKNLLIAGFSNGEIEALNLNVGYPLWSTALLNQQALNSSTAINSIKAAPVLDDENIFAIGNNDSLSAIDYRTGEKIWERNLGGINMPWIAGKYLFILTNEKNLAALNKNTGKTVWQTALLEEYDIKQKNNTILYGPVMINGNLLITSSTGGIYIYSAEDGRLINKKELGKKLSSAPIVADQTIIFLTEDAQLIAYK